MRLFARVNGNIDPYDKTFSLTLVFDLGSFFSGSIAGLPLGAGWGPQLAGAPAAGTIGYTFARPAGGAGWGPRLAGSPTAGTIGNTCALAAQTGSAGRG
jgi:hypothetical protein